MQEQDVAQVGVLLRRYLERFQVAPVYDDDEIRHWLLSGAGDASKKGQDGEGIKGNAKQVTWCYVVEVIRTCLTRLSLFSTSFFCLDLRCLSR